MKKVKTKYKEGYTRKEIKEFCRLNEIDEDKFNEALGVNTVINIDNEYLTYPWDVENAYTKIMTGRYRFWD